MTYVIKHRRHGVYMGHRLSPRTGKQAPRFSWKHGRTGGVAYDTRVAAQLVIDSTGLRRCTIEERKP